MSITTTSTELTPAEAEKEFESGATTTLTAADSMSADRLEQLSLVHQARISQLNRTVVSLTAQYGAGSSQVIAAKAAVTGAKSIVTRLGLVTQQAAATAPTVTTTGWAVYGHVYSAVSKPLSGFCVFLVDDEKNYQSAYGFAFTDSTGSYTINYQGTASGKAAAIPQVFLAVTNAKAQLVNLGTSALALTTGAALYADIQLLTGEPVLGILPTEIQNVAVPPANQTK